MILSKSTFNKGIIIPSLLFIIGVCLLAVFFPTLTVSILDTIKQLIFVNLNWVYVWAVTLFVIFLVYLMFSKFGNIKLGSNDSKPEYTFFSWISMLFAAGMGIGLMYFSVAEPMQHFSTEAFAGNHYINRAKNAQLYTFFHWGIHAWAIYGVVGLALSYFAYRYRLPLSLRSCFYPLLKNKINGKWGNAIDVFALCSTFFGITTTLGFGVVQVNAGLQTLGLVPDNNFTYQIMIVGVLTMLSILSATSGVDKGVKILSNINILTVIILLLFVLFLGPTVYLIGSFTEGIGNYVNNFFSLTFDTHVYDEATLPWFYNWTILYWAWWISWSPYVGLFIAKISKGRTIREFIAAVLIIPTIFNFIWMSVFGNSAMWFDINIAKGALSSLADNPDALMFRFLDYLPLSEIVSYLVILIIIIFFVTSADSGIFVMNSIATKNAPKSPKWQMVFWGALLAILALMLLNTGGLQALQTMTLITALPFSIIMLLFCVSLVKALTIDRSYYERDFSVSTVPWSGEFWKDRLQQIVSFKSRESVDEFMRSTVKAAFEDLQDEFKENGIESKIHELDKPNRIAIEIRHDLINNFIYGVKNQFKVVSDYVVEEENLPDIADKKTYFPKSYFGDAREGYDIQYFTKNELISDVLKHYERFLEIISEEKNEMFISSNANKNLR
ncbi:BCCT family transporter [Sphingobacterium siyangense]|uniref:Choline/glycine/proline betaine transport protein n=1 Tax=Sphingobacterium siyangense TaxID=459529 RepID=A0A562M201_9SPHI|nr:BCCT family transporter [Sphingobacterium siyangense]TWI13946.1 choline/glycine/proline betaine transport protein [Sphingobacterium siyangense]